MGTEAIVVKGKETITVRRVGGAQAEMARNGLKLVKVTRQSAETFYNAGVEIVIVGNNVNDHHFFGGFMLASTLDPARGLPEGYTFERLVNNWCFYNEIPENGKAAYFVKETDIPVKGTGKRSGKPAKP